MAEVARKIIRVSEKMSSPGVSRVVSFGTSQRSSRIFDLFSLAFSFERSAVSSTILPPGSREVEISSGSSWGSSMVSLFIGELRDPPVEFYLIFMEPYFDFSGGPV